MRLTIEHSTHYAYCSPVTLQPHRLLLSPRGGHELVVLSHSVQCDPVAEISWTQDIFGNLIATATFPDRTDTLTIVGKAEVDLTAPDWPIFAIDPAAHVYPFAYSLDDMIDLGQLREPDWLASGTGDVGTWARGFVAGLQTDTLALLKDLNAGVTADIAYRVRDEEGTQSPKQTLDLRSGSCRDIAALFIEAARHLGFGARAVSGYLYDPAAVEGDAGSTHAWAEIFLPGAGWIAFDPTHRRTGGANLVPVAIARNNRQIMPVTGGYLGAAEDFVAMEVSVVVTRIG
ncbi:transglutaminase domain-containing protein [Sphingomonas sp. MMS24-J13]|uniref:transglutaminase family protein n=1 Tax=Sphingomonas sp. MMS24-J13 TaxID=3238686 RepID=UPI00384C8B04